MPEWATIAEFPTYEVSTVGEVRTIAGRMLRPQRKPNGYLTVELRHAGNVRRRYVHRLVLTAHVGAPAPGQVARHLNAERDDNRVENLAWGSYTDNNRDTVVHGHHRNASKTHCPQGHPYTADNLRAPHKAGNRRPARMCKTCHRERERARAARKLAAIAESSK